MHNFALHRPTSVADAVKALGGASDGKIIAAGYPNSESSDSDFLLARLTSSGALDNTFGIGGKVRTSFGNLNGGAYGAVLQADGKVVAAGFQATTNRGGVEFVLARYLGQ